MSNVTGYLRKAATGDPTADKQLFELIYADLKRMAHGRLWRDGGVAELNTTMLVHESYLKFVQNGELSPADDAGIASEDQAYLALEYVQGESITRYCDAHRLSIAARIRLFMQVLDAVQFAHTNLVIHRDLKPSNILVSTEGQVHLLDFGIAKLLHDAAETTSETQLTRVGGRLLTLDYASPEQISGETLTTATDVYSLGVVFYELLVGKQPYRLKLKSVAQLERAIWTPSGCPRVARRPTKGRLRSGSVPADRCGGSLWAIWMPSSESR